MKKTLIIAVAVIQVVTLMGISVNFASAAYSQCSDGFNNDPAQDNLIDSADPGCHTDFNASNSSSYDPTLNSEFNSTSSGGSNTGGSPSQCDDGYDNDNDGKVDMSDPNCSSSSDRTEFGSCLVDGCNPPPVEYQCDDGIDNDGDGYTDYPSDPSCSSRTDNNEWPKDNQVTYQCDDGIDNDVDGYTDYPSDPSCSSRYDNNEWPYDGGSSSNLRVSCDVSDTSVEEGDRVTFEADVSGGYPPYDYEWNGDIDGDDDTERVRFDDNGRYDVEVTVTDSRGNEDSDDCSTVRVGDGNNDDTDIRFTSTPITSGRVGLLYTYNADAYAGSRTVQYRLLNAPAGMSINPYSGVIQWVPTSAQGNLTHTVRVEASAGSDSVSQTYQVFVTQPTTGGPNIVYVPGPTRTIVQTAPVADLDIFNLRVDNDEQMNVIVSFETTITASSRVVYSLSSHVDDEDNINLYEFSRSNGGQTTFHQINLGQLQMNTTYYMRVIATAGSQTDMTGELGFVQLPTGIIFGSNTTGQVYRDDGSAFASVLASIGAFLISPWFLLLIIIILLIILLMRRGSEASYVHTSGPVEIKS